MTIFYFKNIILISKPIFDGCLEAIGTNSLGKCICKAISPLKFFIVAALTFFSLTCTQLLYADTDPVADLNLEDLLKLKIRADTQKEQIKTKILNIKVSSVSKSSQPAANAAAAVFVIDNDAIKRSGATSLPEALRMAPGIDVARINNSKWAVTARGFNGRFANKLLVLIDGRSVYTPDFSGVYWDAQDVMLEDVDRIEIIRGPGATLWGANAMNGVINIITKHAEDTQGGLLTGGGGSQLTGFGALRYGKKLTEETFARVYVKGFQQDQFTPSKPVSGNADWNQFQGGFRVDSAFSSQDNLMVQGNAYKGQPKQTLETFTSNVPINDNVDTSGWNLTSKWNHAVSSTANYSLQFYYDHYQRQEYLFQNIRDTLDLDFQNTFAVGNHQNIIWGMGYRYTYDKFNNQDLVTLTPNSRGTQLYSAFAQDEIGLFKDTLLLTLGSKLEHNDYTGFQVQPSISAIWTPVVGHKIWGSISRAVRTPSRAEANSNYLLGALPPGSQNNPTPFPINITATGSAAYKAEKQLSYQLGYRYMFNNNLSWDITAFYNDYNALRSLSPDAVGYANGAFNIPLVYNNASKGRTYGFEMSNVWQMFDWWRWDLNYSLLKTDISGVANIQDAVSPEHMISLRAALTPVEKVSLDFWLRHTSAAKAFNPLASETLKIKGYVTMDIRLAWQPVHRLELSITGQNLLTKQHFEYLDESYALPSGVPRAVYGKISWQF